MASRTLPELLLKKHGPAQWWRAKVLALDPGSGTTGFAVFSGGTLWEAGQEPSHGERGFLAVTALFDEYAPEVVVCESYRVYSDKALSHVNSDLPVSRLIGAVQLLSLQRGVPLVFQSAAVGKGWFKDRMLKAFGLWQVGMPHANDAVRHGGHYLVFGPKV
jgi:hypothetical protein